MKAGFFILGLSSLMALCATSALGQEAYKNYDIGRYRLPDITRNKLDFSLKSNGEFHDYTQSSSINSIDGNFGVTFDRYRNARTFRGTQVASFNFSGSHDKNNDGVKTGSYTVGLSYSNSSRFYGDDYEGLFFETGGRALFSYYRYKYSGTAAYHQTKTKSGDIVLALPLRMGKGRIERVEDARQAIYILENLAKRKVLSRELTGEEIDAFARLISTMKNKRFFDARLQMIDEVTAVDSFLVASGALASGGAAYFTTLYDYWMYGDLFERKSGTEISGGVTPSFGYSRYESPILFDSGIVDLYESRRRMPSISADVRFDFERPLNLYWQNSAWVSLSGKYLLEKYWEKDQGDIRSDRKEKNYQARLAGRYAFGYYPNSRTNINLGIEETLGWDKYDYLADDGSFLSVNTSLALDLYYYFSPQFRLAVNGLLVHYYEDRANSNYTRWLGNLTLTLTYSLF